MVEKKPSAARNWVPGLLVAGAITTAELFVFRATPEVREVILAGLGKFAVSPGFGGAMALAAAVVAYQGVMRKVVADNEAHEKTIAAERANHEAKLDRDRAEAENDRWWKIVEWMNTGVLAGREIEWIELLAESSGTTLQDKVVDSMIAQQMKERGRST
ncbi:hypothetical protein ACXYTP_00030 [Tsukamurella ocularis]|uniref:hypothetical protein n=1 Tax=Tsukamurella ocularis TaxID=1970234 RepID=UPI0039F01E31